MTEQMPTTEGVVNGKHSNFWRVELRTSASARASIHHARTGRRDRREVTAGAIADDDRRGVRSDALRRREDPRGPLPGGKKSNNPSKLL
jgi:hypothetical protein